MSKSVTTRSDSCLDVLEKLAQKCVHGAMACDKIVCCYIIAMVKNLHAIENLVWVELD